MPQRSISMQTSHARSRLCHAAQDIYRQSRVVARAWSEHVSWALGLLLALVGSGPSNASSATGKLSAAPIRAVRYTHLRRLDDQPSSNRARQLHRFRQSARLPKRDPKS